MLTNKECPSQANNAAPILKRTRRFCTQAAQMLHLSSWLLFTVLSTALPTTDLSSRRRCTCYKNIDKPSCTILGDQLGGFRPGTSPQLHTLCVLALHAAPLCSQDTRGAKSNSHPQTTLQHITVFFLSGPRTYGTPNPLLDTDVSIICMFSFMVSNAAKAS
jgi:hypothetical protein